MNSALFTQEEWLQAKAIMASLHERLGDAIPPLDFRLLCQHISRAAAEGQLQSHHRNVFGLSRLLLALQTALVAVEEIGLRRDTVVALMLYPTLTEGADPKLETVKQDFGPAVERILLGLFRTADIYRRGADAWTGRPDAAVPMSSENFLGLLLTMAEDMRVILIMIAERVCLMRQIRDTDRRQEQKQVAEEAAKLYAPLAHKLGLYKLKSELEDLSLKYLEAEAYYHIKEKLAATKQTRDAYIQRFITPVEARLREAGLRFHIKGRTKSIHSIWQKMKKQQCAFEGIYDLFAIRIIICPPSEASEKALCWQAYSIVTDMYQPNPKRLRDWLSVPKSNGYESLHTTVLGPEEKWVEVQIRTERMDEVAERGVAAHWRYKGVKGEQGLDQWLTGIRKTLESGSEGGGHDEFRMNLYANEVFVFTPKGDLLRFPQGATVLDFAYHIHSKVGNACVGARIRTVHDAHGSTARQVPLRYQLHSGDEVEIATSSQQKPRQEWLAVAQTPRARAKIRLALKETQQKEGLMAKEMLERRLKNRKMELQEATMAHLVKRLGYKETSDFYRDVASGQLDTTYVLDQYQEQAARDDGTWQPAAATRSADEFTLDAQKKATLTAGQEDVLVIDRNLKGIDYQLARCCNPIYGDPVFGFVSIASGIKIHRADCPNAPEMRRRFPYRIVKAVWSGKGLGQYSIALRVVGNDDLGILNNMTSIISKEEKLTLRSVNIDSRDGLFSGTLVVNIDDTARLEPLLKKLRTVKGVKQVERQ